MKELKVDIREIIWELNNEILLVKEWKKSYNANTEYEDWNEIHIENNRYEAEIDMLKKLKNSYLKRFSLTEDDIKKYIDDEWEEENEEESNTNSVNITEEVEVTYTIK